MTTSRHHARVSLAAALGLAITLSACASAPVGGAGVGSVELAGSAMADAPARTIQFENQGQEFVRVYLVMDQREFLLGRVERGARSTLRLPAAAVDGTAAWMRLSVRGGEPAPGVPHSGTMGVVPLSAILTQRWTFVPSGAGGEVTGMPLGAR
jgi:hypothetical protein